MKSAPIALSGLIGLAKALPAGDLAPGESGFKVFCEGSWRPNWPDCDDLVAAKGWKDGNVGEEYDPGDNDCISITAPSLNCKAEACRTGNRKAKINDQSFYLGYAAIKDTCEGSDAGGILQDTQGNGVSVKFIYNAGQEIEERDVRLAHGEGVEKRDLIEIRHNGLAKRGTVKPRLDGVEDTDFYVKSVQYGITRSNQRVQYGTQAPTGSSLTVSESHSKSYTTEMSTELSAGLEGLVSASVSFSMSETVENSNSISETFVIDCKKGQNGILYWYPHWDRTDGQFYPSGDELTIWQPRGKQEGEFRVSCLG